MTFAWPYVGVTAALALVMAAAVWRPRPGQAALLLSGPVIITAAMAGPAWGGLGLLVVLFVPAAYLLVPAALPWRKPWARWAVPATVLASCVVLATSTHLYWGTSVELALPATVAAVALVRALLHLHRPGSDVTEPPATPGPGSAMRGRATARAVVAVAVLQGVAALVAGGVLAVILLGPWSHTGSTNGFAGLGSALALLFAGFAVVVAALYFAVAVGLARRYRDFRFVFTVVQVFTLAVCVAAGRGVWLWALAAWVAATIALTYRGATARGDEPAAPAEASTAR